MSASFPQMAFWVIFPTAALIVLSGWVMILISAIKKLRASAKAQVQASKVAGIQQERNAPPGRSFDEDLSLLQPDWNAADLFPSSGASPAAPLP